MEVSELSLFVIIILSNYVETVMVLRMISVD